MSDNGFYRTLSTQLAEPNHNLLWRGCHFLAQKTQNKCPITSVNLA